MGSFTHIFSPIKIGTVTIPNRIALLGHNHRFRPRNAAPNEREIRYLEERAKGEVGLIIAGPAQVASSTTEPCYNAAQDEETIPAWKKLVDVVHGHGTKVIVQLTNNGKLTPVRDMNGAAVGPSPLSPLGLTPGSEEVTHEMDRDEIKQMIHAYVTAALNMKKAGFDGVQIRSIRGMLIASFLSPAMNKRTDEYGGSTENRLRIVLEMAREIRALVGPQFMLGIRYDADEFLPAGTVLEEAKEMAQLMDASGHFDFLEVGQGAERMAHVPPMYFPLGAFVHLGAAIKSVVSIPVIQGGRINDPVMAEQVLQDNLVDMVGMVRPFIADPEFLRKTKEGRTEEIRKCMACNEACLGTPVAASVPISCVWNPEAGRERQMSIKAADVKKRVVVIGGGPAGCEAARVAALRGHHVTLFEKENELGGQLIIAGKAPGRLDFLEPPRWYGLQFKKLGVKVHLGTLAAEKMIRKEKPDAVVVATGSVPGKLDVPGCDRPMVVGVRDVFQEKVEVGNCVVVVDQGHHLEGLSVADWLSERGKRVELLTPALYAGGQVDTATLQIVYTRILKKEVTLTPMTRVKAIEENAVLVAHVLTGVERRVEPVDTVVLADVGTADDALYHALKGKIETLFLTGAALAPRRALHAFWEGAKAGREI
jgi:2,4-dienoyl-CoA reductase-like NADH-dependent reductase (Old Yellow Enzyme family)